LESEREEKLGRDGRRPSEKAMLLMMMMMIMMMMMWLTMRVTLSDRRGARSKAKEKKGRRPRKHQTTPHTA
jgi:ABC-type Fe3+ transport system permease subunit